jgi:type I restriction enzyme M protein
MPANVNGKKLATQQSVNQAVKAICDIMRRSNCAGALQYVPELTWILFLRILDEREEKEADEARAVGAEYTPSLAPPYRWRDWAAPDGAKRAALQSGSLGAVFHFLNEELLPYLRELGEQPSANRHRAQLPRRHRQGRRDRPHVSRHHPRVHALAGL